MKTLKLSALILSALSASVAFSAPGALDPSFGFSGVNVDNGSISDTDVDLQTSDVYTISDSSPNVVRRYNSSGFLLSEVPVQVIGGFNRIVLIPGRHSHSPNVAVIGRDRIQILGGPGSISTSFSIPLNFQATYDVKYDQFNKRFLLLQDARIAAVKLDGGLDASFASNGIYNTTQASLLAKKFELDKEGRVIFAGVGQFGCSELFCKSAFMSRLTGNGQLDTSFGNGGYAVHGIYSANALFAQESNGRLTLISDTGFNASAPRILSAARFNSEGTGESPHALIRLPAGVGLRDAEVAPTAKECGLLCAAIAEKPENQMVFSGIQNNSLVAVTARYAFGGIEDAGVTPFSVCGPAYYVGNIEVDPKFGFYIGGDNVCGTTYGVSSRHLFQ